MLNKPHIKQPTIKTRHNRTNPTDTCNLIKYSPIAAIINTIIAGITKLKRYSRYENIGNSFLRHIRRIICDNTIATIIT